MTYGSGGGFRRGGGGFGGGFRGGSFGGPREMHKITCSECGKEAEVPFKPRQGTPVYCRDCFAKKKGLPPRAPREEKAEEAEKEEPEEAEEKEESEAA